MDWIEVISLILNLALGGSLVVTFVTLRSARKEASANAKRAEATAMSGEIDNIQAAIKIWREMAQKMADDRAVLATQVEELSTEVRRLKNATNRVIRLLDRVTPENMEETIGIIKKEIDNEYTSVSGNLSHLSRRVQNPTADR